MTNWFGLAIESMVAILLLLTIGYCFVLNSKLRRLKADEHALKATIAELITAAEIAERAIAGLKVTVRECDQTIGERLRSAERFSAEMDQQLAAGAGLLDRLTRIVAAARPEPPSLAPKPLAPKPDAPRPDATASEAAPPALPPAPDSNAVLAAARAFAERKRARASGLAA